MFRRPLTDHTDQVEGHTSQLLLPSLSPVRVALEEARVPCESREVIQLHSGRFEDMTWSPLQDRPHAQDYLTDTNPTPCVLGGFLSLLFVLF